MAEGGSSEGASRVVCAPVISSPSALDGLSLNFNHLFLSISHISICHYITKCSLQVCAILILVGFLSFEVLETYALFPSGQEQLSKEEIKVLSNASNADSYTLLTNDFAGWRD